MSATTKVPYLINATCESVEALDKLLANYGLEIYRSTDKTGQTRTVIRNATTHVRVKSSVILTKKGIQVWFNAR